LETKVELNLASIQTLGKKEIDKRCELQFSRAVALCSLCVLIKQSFEKIVAFDAVQAFGLAGIQWRKHLGDDVTVSINVIKEMASELISNIEANNLSCDGKTLQIVSGNPQAHLHQHQYNFIYIEAYQSGVTFFDAAMSSIAAGGLICLTCTDTILNKNWNTVLCWYAAKFLKMEYYREMAVCIILANLAQAAARYNKGIKPELCVGLKHGFTVICRVFIGSEASQGSMKAVELVTHCVKCQGRRFATENKEMTSVASNAPMSIDPCLCFEKNVLARYMQLGPAWSGNIFCPSFLDDILKASCQFYLSDENTEMLKNLILESKCSKHGTAIEDAKKLQRLHKGRESPCSKKRKTNSDDGATNSTSSKPNKDSYCTNIGSFKSGTFFSSILLRNS